MQFGKKQTRSRRLGVDLTPMVDVVFQLLVFFLTTTQMAELTRADIDLPQEQGEQQPSREEAGLVVNLLADGTLIVSGREVSIEDLEALAEEAIDRAQAEGRPMPRPMIRADRAAPSRQLNDVFEVLRRSGMQAVRLATSPGA